MRISDWSSDVCSSDLSLGRRPAAAGPARRRGRRMPTAGGRYTGIADRHGARHLNTAVARWCVLIPCLNEEAAIQSVVESVLALGAPVIVIDDGSDDRTPELVAAMPVTLLRHDERRATGDALRPGFRESMSPG